MESIPYYVVLLNTYPGRKIVGGPFDNLLVATRYADFLEAQNTDPSETDITVHQLSYRLYTGRRGE